MKRRFKRNKSRFRLMLYFLLTVISFFVFGCILFTNESLSFNEYLIESSLNTLKINKKSNIEKLTDKLTNPEDIVYASLNKIITKEELLLYTDNTEDKFDYDNTSSDYIEDPNPIPVDRPILYIYNTHQLEEYDMPARQDYSIKPNVMIASYVLKEKLIENGIPTVVETNNIKKYLNANDLSYEYSYEASRYYAKDMLKKEPTIKYIIDLHRDAAKLNSTLYKQDDKEYARTMFVIGHNYSNYKKNQEFMNELNTMLNTKYNGLSRGIYTRSGGRFNQDLSTKSVLIEVGGVDNTIEQVYNTCEVLAEILSEYIKENEYGTQEE